MKINYLIGILLLVSTADAACDPHNSICGGDCGIPFTTYGSLDPLNWTVYTIPPGNWCAYFYEVFPTHALVIAEPSVCITAAAVGRPDSPWENNTYDCAVNRVATQAISIYCPNYLFLGRQVVGTDCKNTITSEACNGTESGLAAFDFTDSFFAGVPSTTTTIPESAYLAPRTLVINTQTGQIEPTTNATTIQITGAAVAPAPQQNEGLLDGIIKWLTSFF